MRPLGLYRASWVAATATFLLTGCVVSKSKYLKEQERAENLEKQVALLNNQLRTTQKTKDELARQNIEQEELVFELAGELQSNEVKISQMAGKVSINMVDRLLFDSGSAQLKSDGQELLMKVGAALKKVHDKRISVGGHTDNVAISPSLRGRFASNWELSSARATAVVRFLQDKSGLPGPILLAVGHGQYQPLGDNKTESGRQQNRRIEILLIPTRETLQSIQ